MRRWVSVSILALLLCAAGLGIQSDVRAAAVAGGGVPVGVSVTTSNTAILLANPLRHALLCQNIGGTNPAFITFGQAATATNGFLLAPTAATANVATLSSMIEFPPNGCYVNTPGSGCVPTGAVNAIATGGATPVVCWED